jgi:hemoglobin
MTSGQKEAVRPCHGVSESLRAECLVVARRNAATSFYESIGGDAAMRRLADAFIRSASADSHLAPLLGADPLGVADRLNHHLVAYWSGRPPDGREAEPGRSAGSPQIGPEAERAWRTHLRAATSAAVMDPAAEAAVWDRLSNLGFRSTLGFRLI